MRFCFDQRSGGYRYIPTTYDDENDPNGEGRLLPLQGDKVTRSIPKMPRDTLSRYKEDYSGRD